MNYSAWIELSRSNLEHNVAQFHTWLKKGTQISHVIKGNAYGHGMLEIASMHEHNPLVTRLCVVTSQEALELRKHGIQKPILVIGYINSCLQEIIKQHIDVAVYDIDTIKNLSTAATSLNKNINVHLKIDTAMSRLGIKPDEIAWYIEYIDKTPGITLQAIFSHLANGQNKEKVLKQEEQIISYTQKYNLQGHISNSIGSFNTTYDYDFVRIGIGLYGYLATDNLSFRKSLKPVLSLKSKILQIKDLPAQQPVGYKSSYITHKPTKVATLSIGYSDGLFSQLVNGGKAIVHGQYANMLAINMNYTIIDITHIPECHVHDIATLLGQDGRAKIDLYDWQEIVQIPLRGEYLVKLNPNLPRIIVNQPHMIDTQTRIRPEKRK